MAGFLPGGIGYGRPAGIPDTGGVLSPQQGGLFGSYSAPAGGIFSALKDAAAYLGGGGSTDNFSKYNLTQQDNQVRQQLLQGLTSEDPATRSQAYGYANLLGIPTDGFQKQQAAQALPKLLQSMQPTPEAGTLTAPAVSANLPAVNGAPNNINLPQLSAQYDTGNMKPGMGLTDALSASGSPELQAQYAPQIIQDTLQRQEKAVRPATLAEKTAAGLDPKTPAQINSYGQITPISDPNQVTAYQSAELKHQNDVFGETQRHNKADEANAASGNDVDPQTVAYWAQSVAAGAPLPALGMGKQAALYRQAILKGAAQINNGQGLTGVDQNVNSATTKANTGALGKQTALRSATEGFENTMLQNMNVVRGLLKKGAGSTGIPVINRYQQYIKGQYEGDPDVVALANAIDTVADENAKIRSGTLGNTPATDAMRANIKEGLNKNMTPDQILGAFDVMQKDAGNRSRSLRAQEAALKSGLRGKNDLPQIPGISEPQAQNPGSLGASPLPQKVPAGTTETKVLGGKTYYKINGQWHQ